MKFVATIFDKKGLARLLRAKGLPSSPRTTPCDPVRPVRPRYGTTDALAARLDPP